MFVYLFPFKLLEDEVLYHTKDKTPSFIRAILTSRFLAISMIAFVGLEFVRQLLLISQYPLWLYAFGWSISLYPMVIGAVYWTRNKTSEWYF